MNSFLTLTLLLFSAWAQCSAWAGTVVQATGASTPASAAQPFRYSPEEEKSLKDWSRKIEECAKYDVRCSSVAAGKVTLSDGTSALIYKKPKPEIMQVLSTLKAFIWKYADELEVDPRSIVAGILAENSINTDITNGAKNFLTRHAIFDSIAKNGQILGSYRSVGWGLIHCDTAYSAELYVAKAQKRAPRTMDEVCKLLTSETHPEGAIYAAAMIARQAQDAYKSAGFDVGHKPEIMATLYNLGLPEERAKDAQLHNRAPRPNWFGVFTERYIPQIEQAIGYSDYLASKAPPSPPEVASASSPSSAPAPSKSTKTAHSTAAREKDLPKQKVLTADIKLYDSPGACVQRNHPVEVTGGKKEDTFETVATSIDCDGSPWDLIQTADGKTGWAQRKLLSQSYELKPHPLNCVLDFKKSKCVSDVKDATADHAPSIQGSSIQMSFYSSATTCKTPAQAPATQAALEALPPAEIAPLLQQVGIYISQDPNNSNPAIDAILSPNRAKELYKHLLYCKAQANCRGPLSSWKKMLFTPANKGVSSKDLVVYSQLPEIVIPPDPAEADLRHRLLNAIQPCKTLAESLKDGGKNSAAFINGLIEDLTNQPLTSNAFGICSELYDQIGQRCQLLSSALSIPNPTCPPPNGSNAQIENSIAALQAALTPDSALTFYERNFGGNIVGGQMEQKLMIESRAAQGKIDGSPVEGVAIDATPYYLFSTNLKNAPNQCDSRIKVILKMDPHLYSYSSGDPVKENNIRAKYAARRFSDSKSQDADLALMLYSSFGYGNYVPKSIIDHAPKPVVTGTPSTGAPTPSATSAMGAMGITGAASPQNLSIASPPLELDLKSACAENVQDTLDFMSDLTQKGCVDRYYLSNFYLMDYAKDQGMTDVVYRPMKETEDKPKLMLDFKRSEGKCAP